MAGKKVIETVIEILDGFTSEADLEIYDIELVKEGRDRILRVFIDKAPEADEEGKWLDRYVSTDDCEKVSRFLSDRLDQEEFENLIEENYYLEVSSPGMNRQLKKEKDFLRYMGRLIDIKLYKGLDGKKEYTGILKSYCNGNIVIDIEDGKDLKEIAFEKEQIAKVSLTVIF